MGPIQGIYLVGGLRHHPNVDDFLFCLDQSLAAGIKIFQLRLKDELNDRDHLELALKVRKITKKYKVTFIMNDRPDLAMLSQADGLHIGSDDLPADKVRGIVGYNKILGLSCHSIEQLKKHNDMPVDYLAIGPVWKTDCKKRPDPEVGLESVKKSLLITKKPLVAIGGINIGKVPLVLQTGVGALGVIRGIWGSENIYQAAKSYIEIFNRHHMRN